ncbi:MAG: tRNA glutamyl-Q(34) synthetase GluQRS [Cellvibrionaceae bacterium]|nr:tRNA glutamyl-Q(34) synthetase GluQRS [Cellvibrionaceae bacterium]
MANSHTPIGRFAPSPTGPLHMGSLLAALASYLDIKQQRGLWLLRIEDLDPPREEPGATDKIIASLLAHGLEPDGQISYQSQRHELYHQALQQLLQLGHVFPCRCSRSQLQQQGGLHRGRCYSGEVAPDSPGWAWRLAVSDIDINYCDRLQGPQQQNLLGQVGDFVLRRKDGLFAYQLAVVADDIDQGVNQIVRGVDLIDSSPRQIYLYQCLGQTPPTYLHIPLILNRDGQKLSKQNYAPALDDKAARDNLVYCLQCLGMAAPAELAAEDCAQILAWGIAHWNPAKVPQQLPKPCL